MLESLRETTEISVAGTNCRVGGGSLSSTRRSLAEPDMGEDRAELGLTVSGGRMTTEEGVVERRPIWAGICLRDVRGDSEPCFGAVIIAVPYKSKASKLKYLTYYTCIMCVCICLYVVMYVY